MACLSFSQFASLPRWHSNWPLLPLMNYVELRDLKLRNKWVLTAMPKKNAGTLAQGASDEDVVAPVKKKSRTSKGAPARSRKKAKSETPGNDSISAANGTVRDEETIVLSVSSEDSKETRRRTGRKAATTSSSPEEEITEKKVTRRRTKKKVDNTEDQGSETESSDHEGYTFFRNLDDDNEEDLDFVKNEEDISLSNGWPPIVCCFGAAQHAFVPSGRPANRIVNHEIHKRRKEALWAPERFVRAPGGCSSNVAVALSNLGGKVAFMGKVGDDDWGLALLYYLNAHKVQTQSVCVDNRRVTGISQMKIGKRGGLRMTCVKPCAEDCLSRSEINVGVLKEAKMFYFNTFSLLDQNMRSTTLQAIKISKKLGGVIFYDLNLPLPLWQSAEETITFIQPVWDLANIIEVTKQELEFLCGIKPSENFDTKDNDKSRFVHYASEVVAPLWHENLKILLVTNGTSKVHYYTKEHNGAVLGMEDAPITPFTRDMSASGDGFVAGLMRMLTVQPHLITDKEYLERSIRYAINCGIMDQWMLARARGYPPKEGMEEDVVPDSNGIRSITEREYRTRVPVG